MNENTLLEKIYNNALKSKGIYDEKIISNVNVLLNKIDKNKSLISALITSLLKKSITPNQDIRLHRTDFKNGYSARSLDTSVTTPFFKKYFPKYANKESSFLTLATREKIKWEKRAGKNLKIRDEKVKSSFLELLDLVERAVVPAEECIECIFYELHRITKKDHLIFKKAEEAVDTTEILNITKIINMLRENFEKKLSLRLPVIAIYSIYEEIITMNKRYERKKLKPLNVHTSSDKHDYGDIEVVENNGLPFEVVEIKHNIPIERNHIFDIVKKTSNVTIERYYILTTSEKNFTNKKEEEFINDFALQIKKKWSRNYCQRNIPFTEILLTFYRQLSKFHSTLYSKLNSRCCKLYRG